MTQLSEDVGNAARGHRVTLDLPDGRKDDFFFSLWGVPELGTFERERFALARDHLRGLREDYSQEAYEVRLDRLLDRYEKHEFSIQASMPWLRSPEGIVFAMKILTKRSGEDVWRLFCSSPQEVQKILDQVALESFPKVTPGSNGAVSPASR